MFTLKYYDPFWGGYRRFDDYGDTAYPATVNTLAKAKAVAKSYLNLRPRGGQHAVQIIDSEGKTLGYLRKSRSAEAPPHRQWTFDLVAQKGR